MFFIRVSYMRYQNHVRGHRASALGYLTYFVFSSLFFLIIGGVFAIQ